MQKKIEGLKIIYDNIIYLKKYVYNASTKKIGF